MLHESEYETVETPVEKVGYSTKRTVITALSPLVLLTPLLFKDNPETYSTTSIPVSAPVVTPPLPVPTSASFLLNNVPTPVLPHNTGVIADTSLEMLANVLDPIIQLMVAVSLPIASVIMVGSCFFFMFGNSERAWDGIFKASMGYIIIQMSPLFLQILRQIGEAV